MIASSQHKVNARYVGTTPTSRSCTAISYQDASNTDLKVAHCANTFCVDYLRRR
jgi:hypothetical protein